MSPNIAAKKRSKALFESPISPNTIEQEMATNIVVEKPSVVIKIKTPNRRNNLISLNQTADKAAIKNAGVSAARQAVKAQIRVSLERNSNTIAASKLNHSAKKASPTVVRRSHSIRKSISPHRLQQ